MLDEKTTKFLKQKMTEELKKARHTGLVAGSKAICSVILEKSTAANLSVEERLGEVIKFCKVSLSQEDNDKKKE